MHCNVGWIECGARPGLFIENIPASPPFRRAKQVEAHSSGLERRIREHEARSVDLERAAKEGEMRAADAEGRSKLAEVKDDKGTLLQP